MRILSALLALALAATGTTGCMLAMGAAAVATYPMNTKGKFEDVQKRYTSDLRFGLSEEALGFVEPELQPRFRQEMERLREVRFSDFWIESIEFDAARTKATAVVGYRGYWLSSPFEQKARVVQRWRRLAPSQNWYVTPDFSNLLTPPTDGPTDGPAEG